MNYFVELQNKAQRFEVFLTKLRQRAEELQTEVSQSAQMVYDEDTDAHKRSYLNFKLGIKGQFQALRDKASAIFEEQIMPMRDADASLQYREIIRNLQSLLSDFEAEMYARTDAAFASVKEISAESQLKDILAEYEQIKNAFCCSQCGAPLEVDQVYFVSTYIRCPFCQTQNTFVPSSKMRSLEQLSREVGEERHKHLQEISERMDKNNYSSAETFWAYYKFRAYVWLEKSKVVPVLKDENKLVFFREINDVLAYRGNDFQDEDFRNFVLGKVDFSEDFNLNFTNLSDWSELINLSKFFLEEMKTRTEKEFIIDQKINELAELQQKISVKF